MLLNKGSFVVKDTFLGLQNVYALAVSKMQKVVDCVEYMKAMCWYSLHFSVLGRVAPTSKFRIQYGQGETEEIFDGKLSLGLQS